MDGKSWDSAATVLKLWMGSVVIRDRGGSSKWPEVISKALCPLEQLEPGLATLACLLSKAAFMLYQKSWVEMADCRAVRSARKC